MRGRFSGEEIEAGAAAFDAMVAKCREEKSEEEQWLLAMLDEEEAFSVEGAPEHTR